MNNEELEIVVKMPYGVNTMAGNTEFSRAREIASLSEKDAIVRVRIEKEGLYESDPVNTLFGAFVSNGDGTATWSEDRYPASRKYPTDEHLLFLASEVRRLNKESAEKIALNNKVNKGELERKGIEVGLEFKNPQTYLPGRRTITTFSRAKVVAIDENFIIEVHATLQGSAKTYIFKANVYSRLFDKLESLESVKMRAREAVATIGNAAATESDKKDAWDVLGEITDNAKAKKDEEFAELMRMAEKERDGDVTANLSSQP